LPKQAEIHDSLELKARYSLAELINPASHDAGRDSIARKNNLRDDQERHE
jgi:hypothetical protein